MSVSGRKAQQGAGVRIGPDSPLHDREVRRAVLSEVVPSEFEIQRELVAVLVGDARRGEQFQPGAGMTDRFPDLMLLHAVPNGGVRHKSAAGRAKAEGANASIPDLMLPVPRGPFVGLAVECKRPGAYPTKGQRLTHDRLREHGWLVCIVDAVSAGVRLYVDYLTLGRVPDDEVPLLSFAAACDAWRERIIAACAKPTKRAEEVEDEARRALNRVVTDMMTGRGETIRAARRRLTERLTPERTPLPPVVRALGSKSG